MASITDPMTTVEHQLRDPVTRGFQFMHPRADDGELVAIVGVRAHDRVVDVIEVRAETDVVATRMPADEEDYLAPTSVLWQSAGAASTVFTQLLTLPDWEPENHA
jgi:hypothetical protein